MIRNRNHSLLLRAAVLFVCAVLLIPQASFAAKAQNNTVSSVRVLLTRLNLADEAWMTLEGRYLARGAVCAVEWSENVEDAFFGDEIRVTIEKLSDTERKITIEGAKPC